jgi:hypothetical protein
MTHKSEDYIFSAVKYYLKNKDNLKEGIKLHRKPSTRRRKLKNYK